jgi:hypothetical protein
MPWKGAGKVFKNLAIRFSFPIAAASHHPEAANTSTTVLSRSPIVKLSNQDFHVCLLRNV